MKRLLPLLLALALLLSACGEQNTVQESTIFAMDTAMTLTVYGPREALELAVNEINQLERLLSVTRPDSQLWAVNHRETDQVDTRFYPLLEQARAISDATQGALDITLYPVLRAWGFTTGDYQIPEEEALAQLLQKADYRSVGFQLVEDGSGESLCRLELPDGTEIDFGALAKGYAGERCAQLLKQAGVSSAILRLGGNIQTVGARPDGKAWTVAIQDPAKEDGSYLGTVQLADQAAVTSGGYQRYFERDGVRYWHILDPHTGSPARSGLVSVTVIGSSGTLCDGLSTALFVLGREKALDCWRQTGGFELVLVDESDNVWITGGLKDTFALSEGTNYVLNIVEE